MPVPCKPPRFGVLGIDNQGIAAAAWFELDGGVWHINAAGVALRWQGHRLGDQLIERVFDRIIEHAGEHKVELSPVTGRVHPDNRESIKMIKRFGFVQVEEPDRQEGEFPLWTMGLPTRT